MANGKRAMSASGKYAKPVEPMSVGRPAGGTAEPCDALSPGGDVAEGECIPSTLVEEQPLSVEEGLEALSIARATLEKHTVHQHSRGALHSELWAFCVRN